jgi:exonuclease SbcD
MRFLHTSDWHLGRTLHGVDLLDAQRAVLGSIVGLVAEPPDGVAIDAVLLSGDVYDRAVPPVEAVALLNDALTELTRHTQVVITPGNHDSAARLGFGADLFAGRLHIRASLASVGTPVMIGGVAVYPLPYLDPDVARVALSTGDDPLARSHQAVTSAAMERVRSDLAGRRAAASIVLAHAFVVGGRPSDSERSIVVGGVDHVGADTFTGVDYVALGHLHGAQQPLTAGETVLRYSGSPLRYSFSERSHEKSATLVDFAPDGAATVRAVPLRQPREMADLTGTLDELLDDPALRRHGEDWVRITVTDRTRPEGLFDRIRTRFPHVLQVLHAPQGQLEQAQPGLCIGEPPIRDLAADFVRYVTRLDPSEDELDLIASAHAEAALELGRAG